MKINTPDHTLETSGIVQTSAFGIKNSSAAFQLLSSGLYTNKIRAVLREIGCNAVDAHAMNGKQKEPIEVKLPNRLDNQFYIRDFGPGLSHDQIMKLYSTYFESTKQASDDFIGGFGVGSKSPFAYTDSFTVVSRHKGKERTYVAFVNDEGMPTIAAMGTDTDTTEADGLSVGFPVKPEDFYTFEHEAKEVFSAFKVKPTILGTTFDLKQYMSTPWVGSIAKISGHTSADRSLHVNMGGVRYPLSDLRSKLSSMNLSLTEGADWLYRKSVELSVPIGSISVAASREALQFDKKTIAALPGLLDNAANECVAQLQKWMGELKEDSPVTMAAELKTKMAGPNEELWQRTPASLLAKAFPDAKQRMVCDMALNGEYSIDLSKFKHLHVWRVVSNLHEKIEEQVRRYSLNDYEGRKKLLTNLRRQWNAAVYNPHQIGNILSFSSMSLMASNPGPDNSIRLPLDKKLVFLEQDTPVTLESIVANHMQQPSTDYRELRDKKYAIAPVMYIDIAAGKERAPTAAEKQAYEAERKELEDFYKVTFETLTPLAKVTPPPKVKRIPAIWTIPLDVTANMALKRTLRGIPSSGVGIEHRAVNTDAIAYVVYDRKKSQDMLTTSHSSELHAMSHKYSEYLRSSKYLKEHNIPTNVQLVDTKDLTAFKTLYPNAQSFVTLIDKLKTDPKFVKTVDAWVKNRPEVVNIDYYAQAWVNLAGAVTNLPDNSVLAQITSKWQTQDANKYDVTDDNNRKRFYSKMLDKSFPELAVQSTKDDVETLSKAYPYINYFNSNTPIQLRVEYIESVHAQTLGLDLAPSVGMTP